jgi:predicted N-formylglutamate amidohydrolase
VPAPDHRLLLTCEHGGNRVPQEHRALFHGQRRLLASERGWDPGALAVARRLARALDAPLIAGTTTRLLVDLNRSPHNPAVFSEITRALPRKRREMLLARHHRPHWDRVRASVAAQNARILHLAVHSFTPVWRGAERHFEVGILYDPKRRRERSLAHDWQRQLGVACPDLRLRRNAPYRGNADGLTTALRKEFSLGRYLGLELELNQRAISGASEQRALARVLAVALRRALGPANATVDPTTRRNRIGAGKAR